MTIYPPNYVHLRTASMWIISRLHCPCGHQIISVRMYVVGRRQRKERWRTAANRQLIDIMIYDVADSFGIEWDKKKKNKSMTLVFFISNDKTHFIWFVLIGCDFYGFTCATGLPLTTVWHLIDVMSTDLVAGCTCVAGWYGDTVDHPPQAPSTDTQTSESATRNKQTANKFANVNLFC